MTQVDAIYRRGIFEPLQPVALCENQRVRLSIQSLSESPTADWLREVQALQQQVHQRQGSLPDSTADIAADRTR